MVTWNEYADHGLKNHVLVLGTPVAPEPGRESSAAASRRSVSHACSTQGPTAAHIHGGAMKLMLEIEIVGRTVIVREVNNGAEPVTVGAGSPRAAVRGLKERLETLLVAMKLAEPS